LEALTEDVEGYRNTSLADNGTGIPPVVGCLGHPWQEKDKSDETRRVLVILLDKEVQTVQQAPVRLPGDIAPRIESCHLISMGNEIYLPYFLLSSGIGSRLSSRPKD